LISSILYHLRGQGNDFHKAPSSKLSANRAKDTGSDGFVLLVYEYGSIVVKSDIATILSPDFLLATNYHGSKYVPFFTFPFGIASLTETVIRSPKEA